MPTWTKYAQVGNTDFEGKGHTQMYADNIEICSSNNFISLVGEPKVHW